MKRLAVLLCIIVLIAMFLYFNLDSYFSLDQLKAKQAAINDYRLEHPVLVVFLYCSTYIAVTGLSLPGATILTLTGGAVFGAITGTILANLSATAGATLAFLISRYFIGSWIQRKFSDRIVLINKGIKRDGALYLLSLRMVPAVPFFVVNAVMGLTNIRVWTYIWVSQIGMLAGAAVYANAGTQLAKLDNLSQVFSPSLWLSFALLGLFPLFARKVIDWAKNNRTSKYNQ